MDEFPNLRAQRPEPGANPGPDLPLPEPAQAPLDFEPKEGGGFIRDVLPAVVMIVAVVGLGVLGWYAYKESRQPKGPEEIPIVKAEPGPYKTKPANPGGMEFANTDKSVYDMIGDSSIPPSEEKVEQVIGKPEEPVARDEIMPNKGTISESEGEAPVDVATPPVAAGEQKPMTDENIDKELAAPMRKRVQEIDENSPDAAAEKAAAPVDIKLPTEDEIKAMKQENEEAPAPVPPKAVAPSAPKKTVAKAKEEKVSEKVSEKVKAAANAIPKSMQGMESPKKASSQKVASVSHKSSASGKFRVQLGAYRSESAAADAWKDISKRYKKELSGLEMFVEKANLGTKGIFYRLQAGPFSSEENARLVCNKLVAKKQGCLAVGD